MDTRDDEEEQRDQVRQVDCTDDDDEDLGKIMSNRGLTFKAPRDRRMTYQITKNAGASDSRNESNAAMKR